MEVTRTKMKKNSMNKNKTLMAAKVAQIALRTLQTKTGKANHLLKAQKKDN
jgi:hypothetical protein